VEAGADFVITQFFYDEEVRGPFDRIGNRDRDRWREIGIGDMEI
jgi:5,10-methylenetetrahydrofolate reductase